MRTFLALTVALAPAAALADTDTDPPAVHKQDQEPADPLWEAELRLGFGLMSRGTQMESHTGRSPLSIQALGAVAINDEPHVMAYAGLAAELMERSGVGATAGARVKVPELPLRVGGGGTLMYAPATLWGAHGSVGSCFGAGALALCTDVQMTAYFAGKALPNDETEVQVQLVIGFVARGARR